MKVLFFLFIITFCGIICAEFTGSTKWPELYPYLHCDQDCIDSMVRVNVRWQENQGLQGWNKYRFGFIGNSVTNDGPFPSDLSSTSSDSWTPKGIGFHERQPSRRFWSVLSPRSSGS